MLYYNFGGYEGFKELFGLRECGNGEKQRRNKILLSYVKQRRLVHGAVFGEAYCRDKINAKTMDTLWVFLKGELYDRSYFKSTGHASHWNLCGVQFYSDKMLRDDYCGLCEDGDARSVRYVNSENGRVFKMKAGKFMRRICEEWKMEWPEQVLVWFCEEFANRWQACATGLLPSYTLRVERSYEAFEKIYDSWLQVGNFHSCMNGEGVSSFYMDAVDAKAAWLENADGKIMARCVIFTDVKDEETGEVLRLAERQYCGESDLLKRILVDKLIEAGEIDGYKRVGADCHSSHAFVSSAGESWSDRDFSIRCDLDYGDAVSYQDTFKYLNMGKGRAYNDSGYYYDEELNTTDGHLGGNYDEWNEEYTSSDLVTVYSDGREYQCAEDNLDDFVYVEHGEGRWEYHHNDDVTWCRDIAGYVLDDDANYSEVLDEYYYDTDEMAADERKYKEENWTYSEYDDEYYEDEDDVVKLVLADGGETTISRDSLEEFFEYEEKDGVFYELKEQEEAA